MEMKLNSKSLFLRYLVNVNLLILIKAKKLLFSGMLCNLHLSSNNF